MNKLINIDNLYIGILNELIYNKEGYTSSEELIFLEKTDYSIGVPGNNFVTIYKDIFNEENVYLNSNGKVFTGDENIFRDITRLKKVNEILEDFYKVYKRFPDELGDLFTYYEFSMMMTLNMKKSYVFFNDVMKLLENVEILYFFSQDDYDSIVQFMEDKIAEDRRAQFRIIK